MEEEIQKYIDYKKGLERNNMAISLNDHILLAHNTHIEALEARMKILEELITLLIQKLACVEK